MSTTTEFDPAALDDIDIPALRTSAALHERRNSRPGETAAAQALLHGAARWPWTSWRDALYNSLQEAAGTMSMDTQQDDERLRTLIWAYVVHHPLAYFTQPRPVPEESYTLPALISDRMRCLHDCLAWSDVEFPMVPDGSTEERLRMAQEERINCLLTHRLPMPDLAALEDDDESDAEGGAKKALRRTDSQAFISPVAEPAQNSAGPTIPSSGSPSASSSAPWPASGTSGTAGSTSAAAARNSLRMPPRRESADAGSSGGEDSSAPPLRPGDIEVRMSLRTDPPPEDGEYTVLTAYGWNTMKWAAGAWQQTRDLFGSDVLAWCRTSTLSHAVRSMQRSPGPISVLMHPLKNDRCSVLIRRQTANELPPLDMDALRAAAIAHPMIFNPAAFPSSADVGCDGGY